MSNEIQILDSNVDKLKNDIAISLIDNLNNVDIINKNNLKSAISLMIEKSNSNKVKTCINKIRKENKNTELKFIIAGINNIIIQLQAKNKLLGKTIIIHSII